MFGVPRHIFALQIIIHEFFKGFAADPDYDSYLKDYWKGEVFAYVGSIQNLKDLKDQTQRTSRTEALEFGQFGPMYIVVYFPQGSQAFEMNSQTLLHHEIVIRFKNLPERCF